MSLIRNAVVLACLTAGVTLPGLAIAQTALAPEFLVNTTTLGNQSQPAVASAADGRFVVIWESEGNTPNADLNDIYGQLYSSTGAKVGSEFRVNSFTGERQTNAAVAMNASGDFVVVWNSATHLDETTGVYAQRYAADGTARGSAIRVSNGDRDIFTLCGVAIAPDGDFVVVWPERGKTLPVATNVVPNYIMAQRYTADGAVKGKPITIANSFFTSLRVPSVGISDAGSFVVAWDADAQPGYLTATSSLGQLMGIYAGRYGAEGKAVGFGFQVDLTTTGITVDRPVIAVSPNGSFTVAWQTNAADLTPRGIVMRRYDASGNALTSPTAVDATKLLRKPAIAMNAAGQIAVAAYSNGLYARRYTATGAGGTTLRTDGATTTNQILQPAVSIDGTGRIVAVWQVNGLDGSGRGIYARRFGP
jgi:hypothetical protein